MIAIGLHVQLQQHNPAEFKACRVASLIRVENYAASRRRAIRLILRRFL